MNWVHLGFTGLTRCCILVTAIFILENAFMDTKNNNSILAKWIVNCFNKNIVGIVAKMAAAATLATQYFSYKLKDP